MATDPLTLERGNFFFTQFHVDLDIDLEILDLDSSRLESKDILALYYIYCHRYTYDDISNKIFVP